MIISSPDKFFVPVILLKNYKEVLEIEVKSENFNGLLRNNNIGRELLEDKIVTYNISEYKNVSRRFLEDKISDIKEIEEKIYEDISNIEDENLEYYILRFVTAFMVYGNELEVQGCNIDKKEYLENIRLYVKSLKELYNEFLNLKKNITIPLSIEDQEGIENYFINKVEAIYDNQFNNIKCEEKKNVIDNNIQGIIEETRQITRKEINKINTDILNMEKNKIIKNEDYFKYLDKIYEEIEQEN